MKVCDFGLSRYLRLSADDSTLHKMRGTYAYSAPEVYFGEKYSTKSDVFSTGVILWEIVSRVVTGNYQRPFKEFKIDFPNNHRVSKEGKKTRHRSQNPFFSFPSHHQMLGCKTRKQTNNRRHPRHHPLYRIRIPLFPRPLGRHPRPSS